MNRGNCPQCRRGFLIRVKSPDGTVIRCLSCSYFREMEVKA